MYKLKITRKDGQIRFLEVYSERDRETMAAKLAAQPQVKSVKLLTLVAR